MLKNLIRRKKAKIGIIGLGYVGLPLATEVAKRGFRVIGIDIDKVRVKDVNRGHSSVGDVDSQNFKALVKKGRIKASTDFKQLKSCDVILISVPTPINVNKEPDLGPVIHSTREIKKILRKGQLVILKSTTYPETTEKVILPILSKSGLKVGKGFYLAFCPERIDPGNKKYGIVNTPTVIGGMTKKCTELATLFYKQFTGKVHQRLLR
jgi:UDP-N-acetyl-D-glucosamine dehydrogenase